MKHVPYNLRVNKAVDRLAFLETIGSLRNLQKLEKYTYYGLGGPYLEDFQLVYGLCPEIRLCSIEKDKETLKRQKFHRPCRRLRLLNLSSGPFITTFSPSGPSIFWLDFTKLKLNYFEQFAALLEKVEPYSLIKISLRAEPRDFADKIGEVAGTGAERFRAKFARYMPDESKDPPVGHGPFSELIQDMLAIAASKALPAATGLMFQPIRSFYYSDSTNMFTHTGMVCELSRKLKVRNAFKDLPHTNLNWEPPWQIDLPDLSTKERLHMQSRLSVGPNTAKVLSTRLGYLIERRKSQSDHKLQQYAQYHRYSPYLVKAVP